MELTTAIAGVNPKQTSKHYTEKDKQALISKWQASGLSKAEFCRRESLRESCFYSWTRPAKMGLTTTSSKAPNLIPIKVDAKPASQSTAPPQSLASITGQLIVDLSNGCRLTLPMPSSLQAVVTLIKELSCS